LNERNEVGDCPECGYPLSRTPVDPLGDKQQELVAVSKIIQTLKENKVPKEVNWPYNTRALFRTLQFAFILLKVKEWQESPGQHSGIFKGLRGTLNDEREALTLIGRAWLLLQDFPARMEPFLEQNNFLASTLSLRHCPLPLKKYRERFPPE